MTDLKPARQLPRAVQAIASSPSDLTAAASELSSGEQHFRQVYEDCFGYVWSILRRLGVFDRELEDAVHDVFIVFHRRIADFDHSRPARPWLAGIAARVASDFRRRAVNRREQVTAEPDAPASAPGQEAELQAREARTLVRQALDRLDSDRRTVLVLCDLEGFTAPEVAELLELPLNTAYSRLRLARRDFEAAVRALRGEGTP